LKISFFYTLPTKTICDIRVVKNCDIFRLFDVKKGRIHNEFLSKQEMFVLNKIRMRILWPHAKT